MRSNIKLLFPFVCLAIAVSMTFSTYANSEVIPISETDSTNVYYSDNLLDSPLSPGMKVIAYERPMILSGTTDENIQFSAEIFDDYNGYVPSSVKIISLPDPDSGMLVYNSEPAKEGQSISVLSLSSLYYKGNQNTDAEFLISTDNSNIIRCIMRRKEEENKRPNVPNDNAITTFTRLDTATSGYLAGGDVDGDTISYEIVKGPEKGIISVFNEITGQYVYEPYSGLSGKDSFTYRVLDSYGAYSDTVTVNVEVQNKKAVVYNDTKDSYFASAVNDVVDVKIMQTSNSADGIYFYPHEPVSRIDFLIMAMQTMGAGEAVSVSTTPFSDDSTLSDEEKGYLCAAYNLGIVNGSSEKGKLIFMPDDAINGADAAVIINRILGVPSSDALQISSDDESVPSWAISDYNALIESGILNTGIAPCNSVLTRENVAVILSQIIHKLA